MTASLPLFPDGSVVTVGSFDGLHLGHQAVLTELVRRARAQQRPAVAVTFEPHPASVLGTTPGPSRLTVGVERTEVATELGVDYLAVLRFDRELAALRAETFVREVLLTRYRMRELVLGQDHGFGQNREADRESIPALGRQMGFQATVVPPATDGWGEQISSTRIRAALAEGDLVRVREWLGRPYRLTARVIPGAGRGRTIGMPTINLDGPPEDKALPPDGVWAVWVEWGGGKAGGMLNQGPRPTIGDARRSLEAHLFGIDQDLYGQVVRLEWVARLRDTRRFPSLDALRAQLEHDRQSARAILALAGGPQRGVQ